MVYRVFKRFKYRDFMIVADYIEEIMREDDLISVEKVDYMQNLFYQFKERYDILYYSNFDKENDFSDVVEEMFMDYCYSVFKKIENTLTLLTEELKYSPVFAKIMEKLHELAKKTKVMILKLNPNLTFLL